MTTNANICMGLDPGIGCIGFAFLDLATGRPHESVFGAFGVITTPKEKPTAARLEVIEHDLGELIAAVRPGCMAIEVFIPNPRLAFNAPGILQARGVVLLLAQKAGMVIHEYRPNVVKQTVTGKGNAVKAEVQEAMADALDVGIVRPDDAADALALAWTHRLHMEGGLVA